MSKEGKNTCNTQRENNSKNVETAALEQKETAAATEQPLPYSYHTFMYPFVWDGSKIQFSQLQRSFSESKKWQCDDFLSETEMPDARRRAERQTLYAEYQYFYPAVRPALYGMGHNIVSTFTYTPTEDSRDYNNNTGKNYTIHVAYDSADQKNKHCRIITKKKYELNLNNIRLKIYNTGIGIICFECENRSYESLYDIKRINEYGRRIGIAAVPVFANALSIDIEDESGKSLYGGITDFSPYTRGAIVTAKNGNSVQNLYATKSRESCCYLQYVAPLIIKLLNTNGTFRFSNKRSIDDNELYIYPAIDDRMFVHCLVINETLSANLTAYIDSGIDLSKSDDISKEAGKFCKDLYELIFIDLPGKCSCHSLSMLKKEFEETLYLRWVGWGTVNAVTHHSFMCLTGPGAGKDDVLWPFLTEYYQLSCLCLAQKASLISMQAKMNNITTGLEVDGKRMRQNKILMLSDLQERFVAFSNQLDFYGVTEQYQGVELYNMLREQLYITNARENLKAQIDDLYNTANVSQDLMFNKYAFLFALLSFVLALISAVSDTNSIIELFHGASPLYQKIISLIFCIILSLLVILGYFVIPWLKKLFKK